MTRVETLLCILELLEDKDFMDECDAEFKAQLLLTPDCPIEKGPYDD